MTRRESLSAFRSTSAGDRSPRSGTRTAISRCCKWTTAAPGPRFTLIVHHTDAEREWAYDRKSKIGTLDKAWDKALAKGWAVVDMKRDWKKVFAFE
jgi:hypothetical protein